MKGSKEQFEDMREWAVTMSDYVYMEMPPMYRKLFKSERAYYPSQHERLYAEDEVYKKLFKAYRKAKKELDEYKWNERNK